MSIELVEQNLVDTLKARFGATVRAVESLPNTWDAKTFARMLRATPGCYVVFSGGPRLHDFDNDIVIESQWVVIAVTAHAGEEVRRRHGDQREIGAYEIIELAVATLDKHVPPGEDALKFEDLDNLFQSEVEEQGATIYGARFTLRMTLPADAALPELGQFLTFQPDYDLASIDGALEAEDVVTLPQ